MPQIYKIYINDSVLIISRSVPSDVMDYQEIKPEKFNFKRFYNAVLSSTRPTTYLILTPDFKSLFKSIKSTMRLIKAAGGLVNNEENKYLFIFRNGKWDLPKGKLDRDEKFKDAAVREVEEECGIVITKRGKKICNTYHIYEVNGDRLIKKTAWYWMRADNQNTLKPQLEEGITDARWLAPGDFSIVRQNTFRLIDELINVVEY